MLVRLKPNEKPDDSQLTVKQFLDRFDPNADVIWMSLDEWFREPISLSHNPEMVPEEIKAFIPKWREAAADAGKDESYFCPIKRAGFDVFYHGNKYNIGTGILGDIGNQYTKDWILDSIESLIKNDLYSIGADYVRYTGMVD